MNDLPLAAPALSTDATPQTNRPEYTVSELAAALKRSIEENFSVVRRVASSDPVTYGQ